MNENRQPAALPSHTSDAASPLLPLENNPPLDGFALNSLPGDKSSAELTPFMRQWTAAKRENPDALLFFRMGDFYELFYGDAAVASRELQLTLTARDKERSMPMCGVPYHAVEQYLTRLLRKGYRIAICDQMEDPKLTKKIVRREVTRVLSPGTALDAGIGQEQNNFLAALYDEPEAQETAAKGSRADCDRIRPGKSGPSDDPMVGHSLRDGAAGCFDGRVSHGGVSRRECARSRQWMNCCWLRRARCCWLRARSCRRSWSAFRRGRAWRTGSGRRSLPCHCWSGN